MADTAVAITAGSGTNIDTRTEATNGNHRQVVVLGDPSTNDGVAPVDATNGLSVNVTNASLTVASHAVTNAGTFAVQESGAALTSLQLIDDAVYTDGTGTPSKALGIAGTDGTNPQIIKTDTAGELQVDVLTLPAIPAGTNNIGDVDVLTVNGVAPAFGSGVRGATVQRVTIATDDVVPASQSGTWNVGTLTTLTGGAVAHDAVDSGNPIKVGAKASATLSDDTMVANADRTDLTSDLDGTVLIREGFPLGDLLSERVSDTGGTSTAFTNFGATASTRNYITAISLFNSSATAGYVDFRDGAAGAILWSVAIPAGGGAIVTNGGSPLFRTTANTALAYDVSAALTTVYISITGFKSKV